MAQHASHAISLNILIIILWPADYVLETESMTLAIKNVLTVPPARLILMGKDVIFAPTTQFGTQQSKIALPALEDKYWLMEAVIALPGYIGQGLYVSPASNLNISIQLN